MEHKMKTTTYALEQLTIIEDQVSDHIDKVLDELVALNRLRN